MVAPQPAFPIFAMDAMNPEQVDELLHRAATCHQAGQLQIAAELYAQVLGADPANPVGNHNLGVLAMQTGKGLPAALPLFARAWQADPGHQQHWLSYLRALLQSGDIDGARAVHADGTRRGLQGPDFETLRARMAPARPAVAAAPAAAPIDLRQEQGELDRLLGNGQADAAEQLARQLTVRHPQHPLGWKALGTAYLAQQREQKALPALERAVQLAPADASALAGLGEALQRLGLSSDADAAYRKALDHDPRSLVALLGLAAVRVKTFRFADAEVTCRRALELAPESADAWLTLGDAQLGLRQVDDAIASYQKALALRPGWVSAYQKLGTLHYERWDEAQLVAMARQMTLDAPDHVEAHADLGRVLLRGGRLDEAIDAFRASLKLRPDDLGTREGLLFCSNYLGQMPPRALFDEAVAYGKLARAKARPYHNWSATATPERLRVGLVSGDLREHPVAYFLESVLAHSNRQRVEWFVYSTSAEADAVTARLREHVTQWRVIAGLGNDESARQIHTDGVHILIDLAGHSALNALPVFAWRPAPVQLSWLGYFATTGLAEIDWLLADPQSVPDADRGLFTESVWHLPDTRLCFTAPDAAPDVAPAPAVTNGFVTFGSFQALRKLNDEVLETWVDILNGCDHSRLRVQNAELSDAGSREAFLQRAARAGIEPSRLDLHGPASRSDYLQQHAEVDILLDSFPFPGGTTTCEALWMGVPTVTLEGSNLIGRQGACLMSAAELPDWIASSRADYVALALRKAADIAALTELRAGLRERLPTTPLFDAPRFARALEDALWSMWRHKRAAKGV
jgi:predicted O-linked N-acetylglucosamine transferase (SPINDLY family)